jgi:PAS domain S-box-containing protein
VKGVDIVDSASGLAFEMLEPAPIGVAITRGHDHRLLFTNRAYRSLFGDRQIGAPIREAFADHAGHEYFLMFDQVFATGEPVVVTDLPSDVSLLSPGRFFTFSLSRVDLDDGDHGVLAMCLEITDQVASARHIQTIADQRERILRRYESLVRVSAQIIWVTAPQGGVIEPSPGWERVTGQSWEDYRGEGWLQSVHPDDREATAESWSRALAQVCDQWEHVYRMRTAKDGYRHFQVRAVPIKQDGEVIEWVGTCADIEQEWRERHQRELLDRAAEAMANRASLEETLGALADVIVPDLADGCGVHLVTDLAEGLAGETRMVVDRVATAAAPGLPPMPRFRPTTEPSCAPSAKPGRSCGPSRRARHRPTSVLQAR